LQISYFALASDGYSVPLAGTTIRPIPMISECREVLTGNRIQQTSFFAPFDQYGRQGTIRIVQTLSSTSNNPDQPVSSEDPECNCKPKVVFDITTRISSVSGNVARLLPTGFVNYSSINSGEIIFDLPDAEEIAFVASNCVFPEPGVVIGN
jgi:hypothetical protein